MPRAHNYPKRKYTYPIHTSTRTKLRSGPSIGLEREGLKQFAAVDRHADMLTAAQIWYDDEPLSVAAARRQMVRRSLPMQDMTYGGVSAAWAVVDGMA